jgi:phosphoglycerol transferase MdoB-like AlkP superfamily enzyme
MVDREDEVHQFFIGQGVQSPQILRSSSGYGAPMSIFHPVAVQPQHRGRSVLKAVASAASLRTVLADTRTLVVVALTLFYLGVAGILRIILFVGFAAPTGASATMLLPILGLGMVNDLATLCTLLLPLTLYLYLLPEGVHRSLPGRILMTVAAWGGFFGILFLAVAQYYFFKEFNARFNLVAVDYLIYPHEVFENIFESYHVVSILILAAVYSSILLGLLWTGLAKTTLRPRPFAARVRWLVAQSGLAVFCLTMVSTHSLDFSANRIVNEIAADGISSFFEALHTNHLDYNAFYRTGDPGQLSKLLRTTLALDTSRTQPSEGDIHRVSAGSGQGWGKLNVVVIVEESFGCEQVDACGQGQDLDTALAATQTPLTPEFDALARQGLFFTRAYATGTRTVRGLEAITASFPPIPSESIVKRPGSEHIATWGQVMRDNGYHTSFLYGGFSQFDNMRTFYAGNGFAVSDRFDIAHPRFANIWGVSDQDLFDHARTYFDQRAASGQPFFAIVMTTSNHSPYTFPVGIDGVRPHGGSRQDGVRYADYALGEFLAKSKTASWYNQTLFVIVADHGARVYGSQRIPMPSYEIPLLILAPGHMEPRQRDDAISQIDIAPTVLGLLGLPYSAPFFGQNVLAEQDEAHKVLLFNHNHDVALYQNGKMAVLGLHNSLQTYSYQLGSDRLDAITDDRSLADLATAYYQTAFSLFSHHAYL